jgi:hypothetical protein
MRAGEFAGDTSDVPLAAARISVSSGVVEFSIKSQNWLSWVVDNGAAMRKIFVGCLIFVNDKRVFRVRFLGGVTLGAQDSSEKTLPFFKSRLQSLLFSFSDPWVSALAGGT